MIVDATALYAYFVRGTPEHWQVFGEIELVGPREQLMVSPLALTQLEGMILPKFGREGWVAALEQLAGGAWSIAAIDTAHLGALIPRVQGGASVASASAAVLADHHGTDLVSTDVPSALSGHDG